MHVCDSTPPKDSPPLSSPLTDLRELQDTRNAGDSRGTVEWRLTSHVWYFMAKNLSSRARTQKNDCSKVFNSKHIRSDQLDWLHCLQKLHPPPPQGVWKIDVFLKKIALFFTFSSKNFSGFAYFGLKLNTTRKKVTQTSWGMKRWHFLHRRCPRVLL